MANKVYNGNIEITKLPDAACIVRDGKKGVFIPADANPCLYFSDPKNPGESRRCFLDIRVIETPNSKFNSHMIKAAVGKANREKYGVNKENYDAFTPIIGGLDESRKGQEDSGDIPEDVAAGVQAPGSDIW